jgi:hypothetical protein
LPWPAAGSGATGQKRQSVLPCKRAFEKRDFVRAEVEKLVDDGIDLALGFFDLRRQAAHFCAFLAKVSFPLIAKLDNAWSSVLFRFERGVCSMNYVKRRRYPPRAFVVRLHQKNQAVREFKKAVSQASPLSIK